MIYRKLRKVLVSLALSTLILAPGLLNNSVALASSSPAAAQDRDRDDRRPNRDERERFRREEREQMARIRELDRDHRLRYRMNDRVRTVGYFDRSGNYHQTGYYDRWGFFHRY